MFFVKSFHQRYVLPDNWSKTPQMAASCIVLYCIVGSTLFFMKNISVCVKFVAAFLENLPKYRSTKIHCYQQLYWSQDWWCYSSSRIKVRWASSFMILTKCFFFASSVELAWRLAHFVSMNVLHHPLIRARHGLSQQYYTI